jgi:FkbH-like protein
MADLELSLVEAAAPAAAGADESSADVLAAADAKVRLEYCRNAPDVLRGGSATVNGPPVNLSFRRNGDGAALLAEGWAAQEDKHVWSLGASSSLTIPQLDPSCDQRLLLDLAPYVAPGAVAARLAIFAGEQELGRFELAGVRQTIDVTVPAAAVSPEGRLALRLEHPDFGRPSDCGGVDDRPLGICMFALAICPANTSAATLRPLDRTARESEPVESRRDLSVATSVMAADFNEDEFEEEYYLYFNPDIARAIEAGKVNSAKQHYLLHGRREGRWAKPPAALKNSPDFWSDFLEARARHIGEHFLLPQDLAQTNLALRRVVVVGSCLAQTWQSQGGALFGCPTDFVLTNNLAQLPEDPPAGIAAYDFQVVQISLRSVMHDDMLWNIAVNDDKKLTEAFDFVEKRLNLQLQQLLRWNHERGLLTFVTNFMIPQININGRLMPRYHLSNPTYFVEQINACMSKLLSGYRNAYLIDIDAIAASVGRRYIQDDSLDVIAHGGTLPLTTHEPSRIEPTPSLMEHYELPKAPMMARSQHVFTQAFAKEVLAAYKTIRQADMVKAVVVDLDDTLWNGVSGDREDVGPEMIGGWPAGLIEALVVLKRRGILLAIISKNDEERVRRIWDRIMMGRLKLSDFASIKINWRQKSDNMREILSEFNLLPRSVVFIDDNPVERSSMKAAFPEVRTLGRFPYYLRRILLLSPETQVAAISDESARRTEMIQAQIKRDEIQKAVGREEFLQTLALSCGMITIGSTTDPRFPRAFELVNKTNQFNTTGRRWRVEDCEAAFANGAIFHAFEVQDKFVGYGLVGVVIRKGAVIEQFVMSCRVVGLDVEIAVVCSLMRQLRESGAGAITALFKKTDANLLCRDVFQRCGFEERDGAWVWNGDRLPGIPPHVALS